MIKLGLTDLELLNLGMDNEGKFDEKNIENSDLKKIGIGRILDTLAILRERKLIDLNNDGSFSVTELAKQILWSEKIPLSLRILRLLEIKPFSNEILSKYLKKSESELDKEIEKLRKNQLILMSPLRENTRILKIYEILPDGIEKIKKIEQEGENTNLEKTSEKNLNIVSLIDEIINEIGQDENIKKDEIIKKLNKIKEKLKF